MLAPGYIAAIVFLAGAHATPLQVLPGARADAIARRLAGEEVGPRRRALDVDPSLVRGELVGGATDVEVLGVERGEVLRRHLHDLVGARRGVAPRGLRARRADVRERGARAERGGLRHRGLVLGARLDVLPERLDAVRDLRDAIEAFAVARVGEHLGAERLTGLDAGFLRGGVGGRSLAGVGARGV